MDFTRVYSRRPLFPETSMSQKTRRELVRAYKESRCPMGVFQVRNATTGRVLLGASADLPAALNHHRAALRFGAHRNAALQRDWNALGPDAFAFEVLDTLTPPSPEPPGWDPASDLRVLEALWVERLQPFGEGGYHRPPR
jgi:hypothetical protein